MRTYLLLALSAILPIACDAPVDLNDPCTSEPALTWENFGEGHMGKHCNGCHSSLLRPEQRSLAPVGVDFNTYPMVLDWAERIYIRSVEDRNMPPGGGPGPEELSTFEEWMLCEVLPDAR